MNMDPNYADSPIIKVISDTYNQSTKKSLEVNYFEKFGVEKKWMCVSDYAYDPSKPNHVISFTMIPYMMDFDALLATIGTLAPKEIKKASKVDPTFISFLRQSSAVNFCFIVENHRHLFLQSSEDMRTAMLISLRSMSANIPEWAKARPHLRDYHKQLEKRVREVIRLVEHGKKLKILKNLFLATSIGSFLCTEFANRTDAKMFTWFSDRDEINDVSDNFSIDLFNIQFSMYLRSDCQFMAAPAGSKDSEWYGDLVKIPDFLTGALADYNLNTGDISHEKFDPLIRDLISDNERNVFVFRLKFNKEYPVECTRVLFNQQV